MSELSIYSFEDYRAFLQEKTAILKSKSSKYSLIYFSKEIGKSPAYLKLVLAGKRALSLDSAALLAKSLKLIAPEKAYLLNLVMLESAESPALRAYFAGRLQALRKEGLSYSSASKFGSVFQESLDWEIYSLVGVKGFEGNPTWITKHLRRKDLTAAKIEKSLARLQALNAIAQEEGKWRAKDIVIKHAQEVREVYGVALKRAITHLEENPYEKEEQFDSLCLILSENEFIQIKDVLEDAKARIGRIARKKSDTKNRIAFLNMNLYWASN